jgi:hypothetical protein
MYVIPLIRLVVGSVIMSVGIIYTLEGTSKIVSKGVRKVIEKIKKNK